MDSKTIIGRTYECERLSDCMNEDSAQLIVVYGRRRVGKTYLINEFFDNRFAFKVTGAYDQDKEYQLRNFTTELKRQSGIHLEAPRDWVEAFDALRDYLEEKPLEEKQVVFFDEMPWLDTRKSGFLPAFEWFWNNWASARKNLVFIVCGSATSWMVENLSENKGGLFNRQTCRLYLEPFKLHEVEQYLRSRDIMWSRYEIAECYMIMGGIPYYLSLLNNRYSLNQNIDRLFFKKKGELWDEFEHLYRTLFTNSENYIKVVEALAGKTSGLTRNEIVQKTGLGSNGTLTKVLNNLLASGFIRVSGFYGKEKKNMLYQLSDYYSAFYLRYVKDHYGRDEHFWSNSTDNPTRRAWAGLVFEQLCKDHIPQIKHKLGISGVLTEESIWYTRGDEELGISGAQIDLLIERRDHVINICEMKYSINEFVIDKAYDMVLRNKLETFRRFTNNKKTLQITMITTYGVKKNMYSGLAGSQVILDDLFHE
ncbi:MAG: ATP-binding protein [Lachnospiraceae bacterium]|nr:ATP-binding protein [Lachnospiraceae bacterium]